MNVARCVYCMLGGALACCLIAAGCQTVVTSQREARFKESRTIFVAHDAKSPVRIVSRNGEVIVGRGDVPEATISAELGCVSEERLDQTRIIAEMRDGTLVIEPRFPEPLEGSEYANLRITLPGAAAVTVELQNGRIEARGLAGRADLATRNGVIDVEDHTGPVRASTHNGSVNLSGVSGEVDASTSNGAVTVRLADQNKGPARVRSSNGAVTLIVGSAFTGRINCATSLGSVRIKGFGDVSQRSVGERSGFVVVGDGGDISEARTSLGAVEVIGPER